jgi:hypothetical protein
LRDEVMMRRLIAGVLLAASLSNVSASDRAPGTEINNALAFARLFGVVRYFYPSDAAAELDWNRFAVYGVGRALSARSPAQLSAALTSLFSPLGPGIQIGASLPAAPPEGMPDASLIAWRYLGAGIDSAGLSGPYQGKRTHRAGAPPAIDGFVTMMQTIPATDLRGKTIRFRGKVRADAHGGTGAEALWLRVDRSNQPMGFFDNMSNRPIREASWNDYAIEGPVADDATAIAFGVMASGGVVADFDAIEISIRGSDGQWTPVSVKDPGFEADGTTNDWGRTGSSANAVVTRPADGAAEGHRFLRLAPPPGAATEANLFEAAAPRAGSHVDVDLGSGLKARVPLALSDADASLHRDRRSLGALHAALAAIHDTDDPPGPALRLADVVVAWNVLRHFYPYWTEAGVDWDSRLRPQLSVAYEATTRRALLDAVRRLVADARDGHGRVNDPRDAAPAFLPLRFGVVDGQIVITASAVVSDAPAGAVVATIDGARASDLLAHRMSLASGTAQWTQTRALIALASCDRSATVTIVLDGGMGAQTSHLRCDAYEPALEKRPPELEELTGGDWYVDLSRVKLAQLTPALSQLASATGVIFDLRGYPTDAGFGLLPHLLDAAEHDRWMHVAEITGPFGQVVGWKDFGWDLQPAAPRLRGHIVFLTDGRAISYAESVMGYVADHKLGTIVGGTTAGTNGNVATFSLPGGFVVSFTGMRVTRHDGRTPHHLAGVAPDVPVAPTLAGLRAGRDEVLERAIALARAQ